MKKGSDKRGRGGRPALMVVRRDGSVRPARARAAKRRSQEVAFPVVVEFARGSSTPRVESLTAMHAVAGWLAARRAERVTVVGHANVRVQDEPAVSLARARVSAVTDLLVLLGARRDQLVALKSTRLHSVQIGSTLGERRQRRVVVIFRHDPPQVLLRRTARRVAGALGGSAR